MEFQVKVISGPDEGKSLPIGERQVLLGRSDTAAFRLTDDSVSWEHAVLEVDGGKLYIENLSALGTRLRGQRLGARTRLGYDDELELSPRCRVRVEPVGAGRPSGASPLTILLLALVLLVAAGAAALAIASRDRAPVIEATDEHWARCALLLEDRLDRWARSGQVEPRLLWAFRDAWRLDRTDNAPAASSRWDAIAGALLTLPMPGAVNGRPTFAENYTGTGENLGVMMGLNPDHTLSEDRYASDRAYADALVRFVHRRGQITRPPQ